MPPASSTCLSLFVHVHRRRAEIDPSSDREWQLGAHFLSPKSKRGSSVVQAICDLAARLDRRTKFADYLAPDDVSPRNILHHLQLPPRREWFLAPPSIQSLSAKSCAIASKTSPVRSTVLGILKNVERAASVRIVSMLRDTNFKIADFQHRFLLLTESPTFGLFGTGITRHGRYGPAQVSLSGIGENT